MPHSPGVNTWHKRDDTPVRYSRSWLEALMWRIHQPEGSAFCQSGSKGMMSQRQQVLNTQTQRSWNNADDCSPFPGRLAVCLPHRGVCGICRGHNPRCGGAAAYLGAAAAHAPAFRAPCRRCFAVPDTAAAAAELRHGPHLEAVSYFERLHAAQREVPPRAQQVAWSLARVGRRLSNPRWWALQRHGTESNSKESNSKGQNSWTKH